MTSGEETDRSVMNVETVYHEVNSKNGWASFYQSIRSECEAFEYTCNESKKPQNKTLNRYRDVAPYDHTRIILKRGVCDYIHANLIQVDHAERQYILTQGPLPNTVSHFWLMVLEQNSRAVLMLNKIIEKNQIKCHQYFPLDDVKPTLTFEDVSIKVDYISKKESSDYTTRTLRITDLESNDSREVLHFHYTTWPDFGVPQRPTAFLRFLADVRKSGALDQNVGPPIVHCSAGIGRSGTFCLVDACLVLIEKYGLNALNVRHELLEMRRSRMGLIQTPEQLCFSYAAIIQGAKQLPLENMDINNETTYDEIITTYDEMNNKSNHPLERDDEPPPLPPPRGESLTRSMMADLSPDGSTDTDEVSGPPDKPLPSEPPNHVELSDTNLSTSISNYVCEQHADDGVVLDESLSNDAENSILTNNSPSNSDAKGEVRRRKTEKNERLATQIREMKRRGKEMEERQTVKRSLFKITPLKIGLGFVSGGIIAICCYLYMRS
ncbi:PREDICTED: tyrosine-protein phosphatase non-receptor type 1 isoform X1 [Trachymyrmex cornetzi]|uniref:tyrosine-protein phosphatase non-receptor type 1 isoform X1 n=1 Tax=Trachymyrmex cornetzi TaxID=471704 RepID=UPI00084F6742|nr:PREDICTED: tyrosine-protein phosphatase non-receptor type 1 isoform X1 [Trachymyrmex cornetzi]XP_018374883.1 PREDICTED: tyrosine-protein phosphatase non-receptor type 1 isoform X1 [Trachymyrmex cornetzi]